MMLKILTVLFMSAVPLIEQRGAIPMGIIMYKMSPVVVFFISLLGSLLPFPFIYFFIQPIFNLIKRKTRWGRWIERLERKTLAKSDKIVKYETWGLLLFVGIPLPGTGIWTGTLAAVLLKLRFRNAFFAVLAGAIISALLLTLASTGIISIF